MYRPTIAPPCFASVSVLTSLSLKVRHGATGGCLEIFHRTLHFANTIVEFIGSLLLYIIDDVCIDVQCSGREDVADDGGQRFHIYSMLQGIGSEKMIEIVEVNLLTTSMC